MFKFFGVRRREGFFRIYRVIRLSFAVGEVVEVVAGTV